MLPIAASAIALHTSAQLITGADAGVSGETIIDSRKAADGALFVAFKGERSDGNRYALSALEAGAAAVVLSDEPSAEALSFAREHGRALLRAEDDDCEEFLLRLASYERSRHPE
ncbi:MAG: Mur ligase domain-containing protein, partial [Coriobacteriaceae bacterium]|nr:Mur ligase domain-containing protein [Coriobacteriaceae bacterium]